MKAQENLLTAILIVIGTLLLLYPLLHPILTSPTGMVVAGNIVTTIPLGKNYTADSTITIHDEAPYLIRVSGRVYGDFAKIILVDGNQTRTILDEKCIIEDKTAREDVSDEIKQLLVSKKTEDEKELNIKLEYQSGSRWDSDDDGYASKKDAIDFTVEKTAFTQQINPDKLCTVWELYSLENGGSTTECYGGTDCCRLYNLVPAEGSAWNDTYYVNYGFAKGSSKNILSAQIAYADVKLELEDLAYTIYRSPWDSLHAFFYEPQYYFTKQCTETKTITQKQNQTLKVEVGKETTLYIDEIEYAAIKTSEFGSTLGERNITVKFTDKNGKVIGTYEIQKEDDYYTLTFDAKVNQPQGYATYTFEDIEEIPGVIEAKLDNLDDSFFKTPVLTLKQEVGFKTATIKLPVTGEPNTILSCEDFDFEEFTCLNWRPEKIKYVIKDGFAHFTVEDSKVYALGASVLPKQPTTILASIVFIGNPQVGIAQDTPKTINLADYFYTKDAVRYTIDSGKNLQAERMGNLLTITPAQGFRGREQVTVTAVSGDTILEKTFTITVGSSKPPTLVKNLPNQAWTSKTFTAKNIDEATKTINLNEYFKDPDGDELTYTIIGQPTGFLVEIEGGTASITLTQDYSEMKTIQFLASDGVNEAESNRITLAVWEDTRLNNINIAGLKKLY